MLSFDLTRPVSIFGDVGDTSFEYAWGTAVTVTDFLTAHAGFALKGGNPRFTLGTSVSVNDIDLFVNQSLDQTTQFGQADGFSLQAGFDFGDKGRAERRATVENFYLDALVAFAEGDLEVAMELSQEALQIDPTFSPARETLETARRMQELQSQMEDIRTGEQALGPEAVPEAESEVAPESGQEDEEESPAEADEGDSESEESGEEADSAN
jgi:hypothetical protein